jgi:hypothetical protein
MCYSSLVSFAKSGSFGGKEDCARPTDMEMQDIIRVLECPLSKLMIIVKVVI